MQHLKIAAAKILVFLASLLPFSMLIYMNLTQQLGANPVEYIIRDMGDWGLRFLLITLAITPLRMITGWHILARFRRMMGLYAFFYITLHLTCFFVVDMGGSFTALWEEVVKRKFITAGMAAFILLVPLAATSADVIIKKLGAARWKALHKSIYAAAILACLHFYWMVKADKTEPLIYTVILAVLLLYRVYDRVRRRQKGLNT